ncbi:unnamed protein product, partial [Candidula unifasciata]
DSDFQAMIQACTDLADSFENFDDDEEEDDGDFTESEDGDLVAKCDKETNTEGGDYKLKEVRHRAPHHHHHHHHHKTQHYADSLRSSTIRRSQTFSPTCRQQPPGYVCKLNRSDSDSSIPLYRRTPFQRNTVSRRSLRWKRADGSVGVMPVTGQLPFRTSLDLELDLQASHTKLSHLVDEITRLKELKRTLEESKNKGQWELPEWLSENEKFHRLLSMAEKLHHCVQASSSGDRREYISKQDKRAEHLMKKVTKDVHKMRRGSHQSRMFNFREKMAFFTSSNMDVPVIPSDVLKSVSASRRPSRSDSVEEGVTSSVQSAVSVHYSSASAPVETFSCKPAGSQTPIQSSPLFSSQPLPHNQNLSLNTSAALSSPSNNAASSVDKSLLCKVDSHSKINSTVSSDPSVQSNNSSAHTLSSTAEKQIVTSQVISQQQHPTHETVTSSPLLPCGGDTVSLGGDRTKGSDHPWAPVTPFFLDSRLGEEV